MARESRALAASPLPTSSSLDATFRFAQVLATHGDSATAITKYLEVVFSLERICAQNPGADVDIHAGVMALSHVADLYESRNDQQKADAFREAECAFLEHLQHCKDTNARPDPAVYRSCFSRVRAAQELPEMRRETPEEAAARLRRAMEEEQRQKEERFIRLVNEAHERRERAMQNSFLRRNMQRFIDHPMVFLLAILLVGGAAAVLVTVRPSRRGRVPADPEEVAALLRRVEAEQRAKGGTGAKRQSAKAASKPRGAKGGARRDEYVDYKFNDL